VAFTMQSRRARTAVLDQAQSAETAEAPASET
jgi:hypothetical protein